MIESALVPLSQFSVLPRNAKDHDIGLLHQSIDRWGFVERVIVNRTTGHILSGHGRIETLMQKRSNGDEAPAGVQLADGDWLIPTDHIAIPESEEAALAIALNRTVEQGGWHNEVLAMVLAEIAETPRGFSGVGYDADDLDAILADAGILDRLTPPPEDDGILGDGGAITYGLTITCRSRDEEDRLYEQLTATGLTVKRRSA